MRRRDFFASSVTLAAGGALTTLRPSRSEASEAAAAMAEPLGARVEFHGLNLFVLPKTKETASIDVAFVDTHFNPVVAEHVHRHVPTLKVHKGFVHHLSDAVPAASDEHFAYYTLTGRVQMVTSEQPSVSDGWGAKASLLWKDEKIEDFNPPQCPTNSEWNNLRWLLDFRELFNGLTLAKDWKDNRGFLGILSLRAGELETDNVARDLTYRYRYKLNGSTRLLKEVVRCHVPGTTPFLQFKFGEQGRGKSLVIPVKDSERPVRVEIFHLPTPGMEVGQGQLKDYWAVYDAVTTPRLSTTESAASVTSRRTLHDRVRDCTDDMTPRTGGCAAMRLTGPE